MGKREGRGRRRGDWELGMGEEEGKGEEGVERTGIGRKEGEGWELGKKEGKGGGGGCERCMEMFGYISVCVCVFTFVFMCVCVCMSVCVHILCFAETKYIFDSKSVLYFIPYNMQYITDRWYILTY